MSTKRPKPPTQTVVADCVRRFDANEKYAIQNRALETLFHKHCPSHARMDDVLLKVSALNDFFSTNIFDTHAIAEHICSLKPAGRIRSGDLTVVNEIASVGRGRKRRNFYSFATKYCNKSNEEAFPIFDSFVERMLKHFRNNDQFAKFNNQDLRIYPRFVDILASFSHAYALEGCSLRELDIYLWSEGKRVFGR